MVIFISELSDCRIFMKNEKDQSEPCDSGLDVIQRDPCDSLILIGDLETSGVVR